MSRYKLLKELGRGTMGVVHQAEDTAEGNRIVALKVLDKQWHTDKTAVSRFTAEAKALQKLSHKNIIRVYDTGVVDGAPYMAMELVEGQDLHNESRNRKPLPVQEVVGWMHQAADALVHVHQQGMLHRDLKPANMIVDQSGRLIVMDFGLAKGNDTPDLTMPGMVVGTMRFLPPEVFLGDPSGPPRDVYSLAVTMHEVLTGQSWCPSTQVIDLMERVIKGPGPDIAKDRPDLPEWLKILLSRACAAKPDERPSMSELRDAFAAFLRGEDPAKTLKSVVKARPSWKDHFKPLQQLATGPEGTVHRAEKIAGGGEVAVKELTPGPEGQKQLPRFRREVAEAQRVQHNSLVKLIGAGPEGQDPWVAMELVRGKTLEELNVADRKGLRRDADGIFGAMLEAVAALHAANLQHGDLRPGNVMKTNEGRIVVLEPAVQREYFGGVGSLKKMQVTPGRATYLAPELLAGELPTPAADVWSLGATYFFLVTGAPPFKGATLDAVAGSIAGDPLPDFKAVPKDLAEQRRAFLAKLLVRDPNKRFPDARKALEDWKKLPPPAPVQSGGTRKPAPQQRGEAPAWRAMAPLAVSLVVAAIAVFMFVRALRRDPIVRPSDAPPPTSATTPSGPGAAHPLRDGPHPPERPLFQRYKEIEGQRDRLAAGDSAKPLAAELRRTAAVDLTNDPGMWLLWIDLGRWLEAGGAGAFKPGPGVSASSPRPLDGLLTDALHIGPRQLAKVLAGVRVSPDDPAGWLLLGLALEDEGRKDLAVPAYRTGLEKLGGNPLKSNAVMQHKALARAYLTVPGKSIEREWSAHGSGREQDEGPWRGLQKAFDTRDRKRLRALLKRGMSDGAKPGWPVLALGLDFEEWDQNPSTARSTWNSARGAAAELVGQTLRDHWLSRGLVAEAKAEATPPALLALVEAPPRDPVSAAPGTARGDAVHALRALEAGDLEKAKASGELSVGRGTLSELELRAWLARAGDKAPETVEPLKRLVEKEEPSFAELDVLAGALCAPHDAPWFAEALQARAPKDANLCAPLALALWHSRSDRHKEALDALEPYRANPHATDQHADAVLEILARPLWQKLAGATIDAGLLARLPPADQPPVAGHRHTAPLWRAFAAGDAAGALASAREALDLAPRAPVSVLALAYAAAGAPDRNAKAAVVAQARAAARYNGMGTWVLQELERVAAKVVR